jgi:hypothetical protein
LGHVLSAEGVVVDPSKVKLLDWKPPTIEDFSRSRFILDFSRITKPTAALLKNQKTFVYSPECDEAF